MLAVFIGGPMDGIEREFETSTMPAEIFVPASVDLPKAKPRDIPAHVYWLGFRSADFQCVYRYQGVRAISTRRSKPEGPSDAHRGSRTRF